MENAQISIFMLCVCTSPAFIFKKKQTENKTNLGGNPINSKING